MSHHHHKEPLWKEIWRPLAAFVYLGICILDFGVMPIIYEMINQSITNQDIVNLAMMFKESAAQIEALHTLRQARVWVPLTLQGNGMFHVAFGAILGVSAWTRGQEKAMMSNNYPGGFNGYPGGYGYPAQPQPYPNSFPVAPPHVVTPQPSPTTPVKPPVNTTPEPKFDIVNPDDPTNE